MAVHRHANNDVEDKTSIKRPLGPLLVTIDDLEAICDFLTERLRPGSTVELIFLSDSSKVLGTIDSPEDLQLLTRRELRYVRVQCDDMRIDIFKRKAYCYAPRADQSAIFNAWIQPRLRYSWQAYITERMPEFPVFLGLISAGLYWLLRHNFFPSRSTASSLLAGAGVFLSVSVITILLCVKSRPRIVPIHLPDWNKRRQEVWQHYRTVSIAVLSASIAAATFVLGRLGK